MCRVPRATHWFFDKKVPGATGYFNARTRHFDAITREALDEGIDQLVVLGAGFDTRGVRFAGALNGTTVFEADMRYALDLKARILSEAGHRVEHIRHVPVDFETGDLYDELSAHGYRRDAKTMFLWEGVTYYLSFSQVERMLGFLREHSAPGSAVVFDYVTRAFADGDDHSCYGARQLARTWKKMGDLNRSGISSASELLEGFGMSLASEVDARELERRYLTSSSGISYRAWGPFRIAHARRRASRCDA